MPTITYYRQARRDGVIRTGIEIDQEVVFGRLEGESDEFDPRLTWYVDIECTGDELPFQPLEVRAWLLENSQVIRHGLMAIAEDVSAGFDLDPGARTLEIEGGTRNASITIVYTAVRRFEAQRFAEVLRDVATQWGDRIASMPEAQPITL